jgi:hypothetical protein
MTTPIDASVYPDVDPPLELITIEQKADYLHRVLGAFDFGMVPEAATIELFSGWREIFDRFPATGSPGYHALRQFFGWPRVEPTPYFVEPTYLKLDALEGREDGFEDCV